MPEVELSSLIEKGTVDVGLHDVGASSTIGVDFLLFDFFLDGLKATAILDVLTPIAQFSGLDNPPAIAFLASLVILSQEGKVLLILDATRDMESQRKIGSLFSAITKVGLHCLVKGFFVPDYPTKLQVVCYLVTDFLDFDGLNLAMPHVL